MPTSMCAPSTAYLGNLIKGACVMSMLICLSQAPQNGWETWFSLWYGSKMAELQVRIPKLENVSFQKALSKVKKEVADTAKNADPKRPATKNTYLYIDLHKRA